MLFKQEIRDICDLFAARGLPNFPSGIIFSFWEQYINLRFFLMLAVIAVLVAEFVVITVVLLNPWAAIIVVSLRLDFSVLQSFKAFIFLFM